uniref:Uncharacterized protein n=1 Tax=Romanomermis culicivorax TaxID=13658 RepID=A0A915IJT0_ROMCU
MEKPKKLKVKKKSQIVQTLNNKLGMFKWLIYTCLFRWNETECSRKGNCCSVRFGWRLPSVVFRKVALIPFYPNGDFQAGCFKLLAFRSVPIRRKRQV